jgi:hypothetical protein
MYSWNIEDLQTRGTRDLVCEVALSSMCNPTFFLWFNFLIFLSLNFKMLWLIGFKIRSSNVVKSKISSLLDRVTCQVVNCLIYFGVGMSAFCLKKRKEKKRKVVKSR